MKNARIIIVDDNHSFRSGLKTLLTEQGFFIQGEAENGQAALARCKEFSPDIVLMDLQMPGSNGVDAIKKINKDHPRTKIIALTTFEDDHLVFNALKNGAIGYLLKGTPIKDISSSILSACHGEPAITPSITKKLISEFSRLKNLEKTHKDSSIYKLSPREAEVLRCLATGLSNKDISNRLNISIGTTKNHLINIYSKLNVNGRTEAAIKAREIGLT